MARAAESDWSVLQFRAEVSEFRKSPKSIPASRERLEDVEPREHPARTNERKVAGILRSIKQAYPPADAPPDNYSDADIEEIIDACSPLSEAWADFRQKLESSRDERLAKKSSALH